MMRGTMYDTNAPRRMYVSDVLAFLYDSSNNADVYIQFGDYIPGVTKYQIISWLEKSNLKVISCYIDEEYDLILTPYA